MGQFYRILPPVSSQALPRSLRRAGPPPGGQEYNSRGAMGLSPLNPRTWGAVFVIVDITLLRRGGQDGF